MRNFVNITAVVMEPTTVSWDWVLDSHDITFRVEWVGVGGDAQMLAELDRYPATDGPCTGSYEAPGPGRLQFVWDNSHSWMRP